MITKGNRDNITVLMSIRDDLLQIIYRANYSNNFPNIVFNKH